MKWQLGAALALIVMAGGLILPGAAAESSPCSGTLNDEGIAACTQAIDAGTMHGRDLAAAYVARGHAYLTRIDFNHALADFNRAIEADAGYAPAYDGRGQFLRFDPALAIKDFDEAIRLDPNNAAFHADRGWAYLRAKDSDRARADANEAIRLDAASAAAFHLRGIVAQANGDHDGAIADLTEAIRLAPNDRYAYLNRGEIYQTKGDLDRALADFDQIIRLGPFTHAYVVRGSALMQKGDRAAALRDFEEAIRRSPSDAEAYRWRAVARENGGDAAGAAADRARAHALSTIAGLPIPLFTTLHEAIGVIAILSGFVVAIGMIGARRMSLLTALFFASTILASAGGLMFHLPSLDPLGTISLVVVAVALAARYGGRLAGHWRWVYVIAVLAALYLDVYLALTQVVFKLSPLVLLMSRGAEWIFPAIQIAVIVVFLALCAIALRTYRPQTAAPAPLPAN